MKSLMQEKKVILRKILRLPNLDVFVFYPTFFCTRDKVK